MYGGAYFAMVEIEPQLPFRDNPLIDILEPAPIEWIAAAHYRFGHEYLSAFFAPAHAVDRALFPNRWSPAAAERAMRPRSI
jgi:hypothetical protein